MILKKKLSNYQISHKATFYQLIKKINFNGKGFSLVIDDERKVRGIFTDGDIRRLLLKKIDLNEKIYKYCKKSFNYISEKKIFKKNYLYKYSNQIPILAKNKILKGLILKSPSKNFSENTIFVLAGGKGLRMGKLSKKTPKPMLKINDKPILEKIISSFKKSGFRNFIISTKHLSNKIIDYFGDGSLFDVSITYTKEKKQLGTAGSLSLINSSKIQENLFVTNGDLYGNLNYSNMMKIHKKRKNDLTICARLHTVDIPYGLININDENLLNEKPKLSYLINSGIYILKKKVIKSVKKNTYLDMNDLINLIKKKKFKVGIYSLYEPVYDIGDLKKYKSIKNHFKKRS